MFAPRVVQRFPSLPGRGYVTVRNIGGRYDLGM